MGNSKNIKHSVDILNLLILQNGGSLDTSKKFVNITNRQSETAMKFYTDFLTEHKTWSPDLRWDLEMFYSGNLAMMFGPSWRAFDIIQANPSIEIGVSSVPQLPNNPPVNYGLYWGHSVAVSSPNSYEAWKFIEYLSQREQMQEYYSNGSKIRAFGQPYSRVDLAQDLSNNPYVAPIMESAPTMKSFKMGYQTEVESYLRTAINDVAENSASPEDALSLSLIHISEPTRPY